MTFGANDPLAESAAPAPVSFGVNDPVAPAAPAQTAPSAPSTGDQVAQALRPATIFAGGVNRGVASIVGAPTDAVNYGLKQVGLGVEKPVLGSGWLTDAIESLNAGGHDPQNGIERALQRGGKEVGANLVPAGLLLRGARGVSTAVNAVEDVGKLWPAIREALTSSARSTPGAFAATDSALAASGGVAASAAGDATGHQQGWKGEATDFVANLAGSLGPVGAIQAIRSLLHLVPVTTGSREAAAARDLGLKESDSLLLNEAERTAPKIDGVDYAPAELLNNPALLTEKRRLDRSSPSAAIDEVTRQDSNNAALRTAAVNEAPAGDVGAPRVAVARQAASVDNRLADAQAAATEAGGQRVTAAQAEADQLAADARARAAGDVQSIRDRGAAVIQEGQAGVDRLLGDAAREPDRVRADASVRARDELHAAQDSAEQSASRLFQQVDPEGKLRIEATPVSDAADRIVQEAARRGREDAIPDMISSGRVAEFAGTQPFERIQGLRSMIGEQIRAEQRGAGSRQKIAFLTDLQRSVDDTLDGVVQKTISDRAAAGDDRMVTNLTRQRDDWIATRNSAEGQAQARDIAVGGGSNSRGYAGGTAGRGESIGTDGARAGGSNADPRGASVAAEGGPSGIVTPADAGGDQEGAAAALRAARDFFRENVAQRFRQGTVRDVLKTGPDNRPAVAPADTLGRFVIGREGSQQAVQDYVAAVGDRPAAVQALRDYAVADLSKFATDPSGQLRSMKVAQWRTKHQAVLDAFPELNQLTGDVHQLQSAVEAADAGMTASARAAELAGKDSVRQADAAGKNAVADATASAKADTATAVDRRKRSQAAIEDSAAAFWLDREPSKAVAGVLASGDSVQAAKETVVMARKGGGTEATNGVARAAWDHVTDRIFSDVENGGVKAATAAKLLREKEGALRVLMGDEAYGRAQDMLKAAQITSRASRAVVVGGSDTRQNFGDILGKATKESMSIIAGTSAGYVIQGPVGAALGFGATVAGKVATEVAKAQQSAVQALMRDALNNPATFRLLTKRITTENENMTARAIGARLVTLGVRTGDEAANR